MPFYNKGPQPVVPYTPNGQPNGGAYPLDVATVGGLSVLKASIAAGAATTVLAAPAAGTCYVLHHFAVAGTTATFMGLLGQPSGVYYSFLVPSLTSEHLAGQLVLESLEMQNGGGSAFQGNLTYDVIEIPHIQ
jgi:hypothetical protein